MIWSHSFRSARRRTTRHGPNCSLTGSTRTA